MKKIIIALAILLCTLQIQATSIIKGEWNRYAEKLYLYKVEAGNLVEQASYTLTKTDRTFSFALDIKEAGFYTIGASDKINNFNFYLKPNDNLEFTVAMGTYTLRGENSNESKDMERWQAFIYPLEERAMNMGSSISTYVDFFPLLEDKLDSLTQLAPIYSTDTHFTKTFEDYKKNDLLKDLLMFIFTPRSAHPQGEDYPDVYRELKLEDYTKDNTILQHPQGRTILALLSNYEIRKKMEDQEFIESIGGITPQSIMQYNLPKIENKEVQGYYVLDNASSNQTYDGLLAYQNKYSKYLANDEQKEIMKNYLIEAASNAEGEEAFDFTFPDVKGKDHSLADFKGKLVYIDIWATWCGPCLKEIPYLKTLEKAYHGKDVVFMSISIDKQKDYDKWKEMLVEKELAGVQLFAGERAEDITKPYKVGGIPRFLLIGKDGKMISGNAPRPSSDEIKILLDASLAKRK